MKICITTASVEDSKADVRFARSMHLGVYDTDSKEIEFVENEGFASNHGAGIAAAHQVLKLNVDVIITGNVGPNAYEILEDGDIKIFKLENMDIYKAIEDYNNNKLKQIENAGPKHFGVGSSK